MNPSVVHGENNDTEGGEQVQWDELVAHVEQEIERDVAEWPDSFMAEAAAIFSLKRGGKTDVSIIRVEICVSKTKNFRSFLWLLIKLS